MEASSGRPRRVNRERGSYHAPEIQISNTNGLYDSGIGQDVGVAQPLSMPSLNNGKPTVNGGSSPDVKNGFGTQTNDQFSDNGIQYDMDPLEYEFLQQQINSDDIDENGILMDSLAITSNSLSGSRTSLVCYDIVSIFLTLISFLSSLEYSLVYLIVMLHYELTCMYT